MRKFLITMMCIVMVVCFMPTVAMAETGSVIQISSSEELAKIGTDENYPLNGSYELTNNITLSGEWTPIGTEANTFKGVFNGKNFTISGLTINSSNNYIGLIGILDGGRVENVKFANVSINGGSDVGAAVGRIINNGTVSGVEVLSGSVSSSGKRVGGIVGSIKAYGTVKDCSNAATVTASIYNAGGIVGAAYYTVNNQEMYVKGCTNTGEISGPLCVGGIVGLSAANISNCTNSGAVSGNGTSIGGIVGEQKTYGSVSGNINNANVTNNKSDGYGAGGIIGWLRYHGAVENVSYAQSAIISVTGNVNKGSVAGGNDAGGIIGTAYNSAVITGNTNIAKSLTATTFAAGIVGNYQTTETPAASVLASNQLIFDNNTSITPNNNISADSKDLLIYTNGNKIETYVAQIGTGESAVRYTTIAEAIRAANDGDTITLMKDCETTVGYTISSPLCLAAPDVTFDLNGKTLTVTNNFSFLIKGDRDIVKNGTIQAGTNSKKTTGINSYALVLNGCDGAVVENVISHGGISVGGSTGETPNASAATNAVIKDCNVTSGDYYAICAQQNSTVTIESGIYTADTRSTIAGVLQGTFIGTDGPKGTITVTGGTFNGAINNNNNGDLVFKGGTFSIDPTAYKSDLECYTVVKNTTEPETWTVTAGHTWNEGVVTTDPTYDTTGLKTYTCTVGKCGATKTEVIPKKDRPYIPSTPTVPTDNVTNSGSTTTDNAATNADLSGSTSTSNGTTSSTVDKTTADKIVDKAVENKSTEVVIDATANSTTAANSTTTAQVTIPTETLGAIAEKTEADVTIKTDVAEVKMDNAAAAAVSEQAEGDTVQIIAEKVKEDATEVHFELKVVCSDGKVISDFKGGNVAVTVALPKAMADKKVVCVYIDDNGHMSKVAGQKNADGTYTFNTGHFSSYAIMAEEEADAAIAAQKEAIKNIKIKLTSKQVKTKAGKKAVKITWTADAGDKVLDGVEVFRSTERYKGYGTEPFYTSTKGGNTGSYTNTKSLKKGTKYYYRVRGYVLVNGEKVYTDYSTKAWRTVK